MPPVFTNVVRRKKYIECQTLDLMKRNQKVVLHVLGIWYISTDLPKINVSHQEVILMSKLMVMKDISHF